jgi:hypothetical protein
MKVIVGQIASVTDLARLKEQAKDKSYLGFTKSGQIYVIENGSHRVLQPQEAIAKTGIDPELLKTLIASGGIIDEEPEEIVQEQELEPTPEEVPVVQEEPVVEEPVTSEHEEVVEEPEEEAEPELNVSRKVLKRISKLEDLLVRAAEEVANLKNEITQ